MVAGRIDVSKIRILSRTRTYPGWVYAARKSLAPNNLNKIKQVSINLLNNAFDAIGSNGKIFVGTGEEEPGSRMQISVTDTGCGIDTKIVGSWQIQL